MLPARPTFRITPAKIDEALRFFRWVLTDGQADSRSLTYVPLPDGLVKQIDSYLAQNIK